MQLDIPGFLKVFGISIPDDAHGVNRPGAVRCRCPLHQDPDGSMRASRNASGEVRFDCLNPRCGFHGDAVSLVALARGVTVESAVGMFRPGGEFSVALTEPLREIEARAYLEDSGMQASVRAYLLLCERALKRAPEKANIRPGLSAATRALPDGVGMFVWGDGVPRCLSEFSKPRYRGSTLLLYPYTFDGDVTYIEVRDANSPLFRQTVPVTRHDIGVYGESVSSISMGGGRRTVFVASDPLAAVRVRCAYSQHSSGEFPIVASSCLPFPDRFDKVGTFVLTSFDDFPVSLESALSYIAADEIVSGRDSQPSVRVLHVGARSSDFTYDMAERLLSGASGRDVAEWSVRLMVDLASKGRTKEISDALAKARLPPIIASAMARFAATCSEDRASCRAVAELVERPVPLPTADIVLANGRSIRRGPASIMAIVPKGFSDTIANVGLSVDSKIVSYSGEEVLSCTVVAEDKDVPHVRVNLPESSWGSAAKVQKAISKAFVSRGFNPYVMCYDLRGYGWRDILGRLSERCPVTREVGELGIDDVSDIQLPSFAVRSTGEIVGQSRVFTLPENALRVYGGLSASEMDDPLVPWRLCLEKCDNLYVAAFVLGAMHALYQMTFGMYRPEAARRHANRHLFYVETEPGIWAYAFKQVADLFSGADFTPTLNYANPSETLSGYRQLGCLPLIAYVPTMGEKLSRALDESSVDLIGLLDTSTAVMTNGRVSAVYVTPSKDAPAERRMIAGSDLDRLRASFPHLLSHFVREASIDGAYRSSSVPCVAAYGECCRILGVAPQGMDDIAKTWFPGTGMNGADMFFDLLHRGVSGGRPKLYVVNGMPQSGRSFTGRGQHAFVLEDRVVVSHMVVDMINKAERGVCEFSSEQLSREMEERGLLVGLPEGFDPSRCWCLSRETWENRVVRPPINLSGPVSSGAITLDAINE